MVKIEQSNGTISITNEVFTNLAGDAATSCFGVKGMVGRSKDSGPFQLLRRESMSKGVNATFADDGSHLARAAHRGRSRREHFRARPQHHQRGQL